MWRWFITAQTAPFYLNGVFAGQGSAPTMTAETDPSTIGNIIPNDSASFNGGIDELSIYDRALSFDEIAAIYLAGSYGKCLSTPLTLEPGSAKPSTTNGMCLMLQGAIGPNYVIQASTNLVGWTPITNFAITNSPFYFTDPNATNYKWWYYRATTP
jgi:hypothetical protein